MWLPAILACVAVCLWLVITTFAYASRRRTRRWYGVAEGATVVGFFHPFCAGGGGGERVLWRAVHTLSRLREEKDTPLHVLIYTGDVGMTPEDILSGVARQFEISIDPAALPVSFVYLRRRGLLDASLYPVLTMLAQSVASVVLAAEALLRGTPDVFVDTTGFAFSFPVAWLAGCSVGAYVHYPTISTVRHRGDADTFEERQARGDCCRLSLSCSKIHWFVMVGWVCKPESGVAEIYEFAVAFGGTCSWCRLAQQQIYHADPNDRLRCDATPIQVRSGGWVALIRLHQQKSSVYSCHCVSDTLGPGDPKGAGKSAAISVPIRFLLGYVERIGRWGIKVKARSPVEPPECVHW